MGVARLEIELRDGRSPKVHLEWSAAQLLHAVDWLQRANARGADVMIRPAGAHGLVLVGELDATALERLTGDGFEPAVTVEVRPGRYEAWVKLSEGALPQGVRWAAGAGLARRCNGRGQVGDDPPFGRLAGFTPSTVERGGPADGSAAIGVRDGHGRVAPAAAAYLEHVERALDAARRAPAAADPADMFAAPQRDLPRPLQHEMRITRDQDRE